MIFKWIIAGFIIYSIYRWVDLKRIASSVGRDGKIQDKNQSKDGEYIDYEEIK